MKYLSSYVNKIVIRNLVAENYEEALTSIAQNLLKKNYVKEEFIKSIIEREEQFPTGLPSSFPSVAIPHTDYQLVNQTSIAIATLSEPVKFRNMENNSEKIDVNVIIMLAIAEPKGQIEMLQKIVGIISDEDYRQNLITAESDADLLKLIDLKL